MLTIATNNTTEAQGTPALPYDENTGPDPDNPTPIPFDGGITLLVAAGAAYGLRSAKKQMNQNK